MSTAGTPAKPSDVTATGLILSVTERGMPAWLAALRILRAPMLASASAPPLICCVRSTNAVLIDSCVAISSVTGPNERPPLSPWLPTMLLPMRSGELPFSVVRRP